jgi:hypothetical protein
MGCRLPAGTVLYFIVRLLWFVYTLLCSVLADSFFTAQAAKVRYCREELVWLYFAVHRLPDSFLHIRDRSQPAPVTMAALMNQAAFATKIGARAFSSSRQTAYKVWIVF